MEGDYSYEDIDAHQDRFEPERKELRWGLEMRGLRSIVMLAVLAVLLLGGLAFGERRHLGSLNRLRWCAGA